MMNHNKRKTRIAKVERVLGNVQRVAPAYQPAPGWQAQLMRDVRGLVAPHEANESWWALLDAMVWRVAPATAVLSAGILLWSLYWGRHMAALFAPLMDPVGNLTAQWLLF